MGNLKGVVITKGSTGPNATGLVTSGSAIISNAPVANTDVDVNTVYVVSSVKQAEDLGITPETDIANDVVLHRHIVDFFSMAGEGVKLRVMLIDADTPALALSDAGNIYARKLIADAGGIVKQIAICWNIDADADPETLADGFNSLIRAAIAPAQDFALWAYSIDKPCNVVLEGRRLSDTMGSAIDVRDITVNNVTLEADHVSIAIGQDWNYAEARLNDDDVTPNTKVHYYADAGKLLGVIAAAEINQSVAEVASFNLSDATKGYYVKGGLSNHLSLADAQPYLQDLEDKSYIFPIDLSGISGLRYNNDHVCTPIIIDADGNYNEHMIYYGRTLDACALNLKSQLLYRLKSRVSVDPTTGKLSNAVIKNLEAESDINVFGVMAGQGLIVDGKTFIDADSDLLTAKRLSASFEVVAYQIIGEIIGTINLKKSINL